MLAQFKGLFGPSAPANQIILANPGEVPPSSGVVSLSKKHGRTKVYSAEEVGGKGANLLKLRGLGVNVPSFLVIPAAEFDLAVERACASTGASFAKWVSGEDPTAGEKLCQAIDTDVSLSQECLAVIKHFITSDPSKSFAVRSSATMEDGSDSAFAGQFDTVLNCHGEANIVLAVKQCWKSLLSPTVLPFYGKHGVVKPRMAVVIQEQIFSTSAGVYFQANPVTGASSTHIINVAFGQGEGVVSGLAQSDEFWLNASTGHVFKRVIGNKTTKVGLQEGGDGTRQGDEVSPEQANLPAISDEQIAQLYQQVQRLRSAYKSAQDVEFAFQGKDLYLLQARPITTRLETLSPFQAKEMGLWRLNAHVSRPMSALYDPIWCKGWSSGCLYNSELVGSGFVAVDTMSVNGFGYFCMRTPGPKKPPAVAPGKRFMRLILTLTAKDAVKAAKKFWGEKTYLDFAKQFEQELKPEWIRKHRELAAKYSAVTSTEQLLEYVNAAHEHMVQAWYAHVTYTLPQMLPSAHFAILCQEWTGCSVSDAYEVLEGFSPVTSGWQGEFPLEMQDMRESLPVTTLLANETGKPATEVLDLLKLASESAKRVITDVEYRLLSGYDPANDIVKDEPEFLLAALKSAVQASAKGEERENADTKSALLRAKVPVKFQSEFDLLLTETRSIMKVRDERAIYTDLWAAGILHDAVVRAAKAINVAPELFVEASIEEIRTSLKSSGITPELQAELVARKLHRDTASIRDAPDLIGGVDIAITKEHFPSEWLARSFAATMVSIAQLATPHDFEAQYQNEQQQRVGGGDALQTLYGLPCSQGEVEGLVRVVKTASDIASLQKGEVIVTESPSSLINLVLPFACAIVCDFGATLSHAAVCSRELGLPCIVGTKIGTVKLQTGQRVRVNGTTGTITIL
ncbi:hypothetical protein BASA81_000202 [Batrachochytrium salamandrivorans]|nr:hypothetical protein BASA81_000202 [Batrachochytrium salamandrivorans]